jgi:PAS domain S-box-containing protein
MISLLSLKLTAQAISPKTLLLPAIFGAILGFFLFKRFEGQQRYRLKLLHLNGVLRSIRKINQILSQEREAAGLIQSICDTLVENRNYHSVWIALTDADGNWGPFAQAGLDDKFSSLIDRLEQAKALPCCRQVLAQKDIVITDVPAALCGDCPLIPSYHDRGAMSARLECNNTFYGMITLCVPPAMLFDSEEKRLVEELAAEIAFGLHAIEADRQRKASEDALSASLLTLKGRMRELNCLYGLSEFTSRRDRTIPDIMAHTVQLITSALQHPEISCAQIQFDGKTYQTNNFEATDRQIEKEIVANGETIGSLTVGYMKTEPKSDADPFQLEEKTLVRAVAERLGKIVKGAWAQKDLLESENRFRVLVENSLTGISIVQGSDVVYQNKEQERLLGPLPRPSIMGADENIHPDDRFKVKQFSRDISQGNFESMEVDFRFLPDRHASGSIWIHCRAAAVVYRKKDSVLFNMMDITKPKHLEQLLITQDKMASLGRVAAGIAHEIRNPLSGINIYVNTLEKLFDRGEDEQKVKKIFFQLQTASRKIESVIRRVMDFSKPNQPSFILSDVKSPIEEALKLTATTLRKSGVLLEDDLAKDLPLCHLDPQQIEEVVLNLINNAADAMRGSTGQKRIKIVSMVQQDHVVILVLDSGPGIAPENGEKIFDPFFTTKSDSTGIGLSICRRIISDHRGAIEVGTSPWGGTEFRISIPVAKPAG